MADNTLFSVKCLSPKCKWKNLVRKARYMHLGDNLYTGTDVRCECGQILLEVKLP